MLFSCLMHSMIPPPPPLLHSQQFTALHKKDRLQLFRLYFATYPMTHMLVNVSQWGKFLWPFIPLQKLFLLLETTSNHFLCRKCIFIPQDSFHCILLPSIHQNRHLRLLLSSVLLNLPCAISVTVHLLYCISCEEFFKSDVCVLFIFHNPSM